MEPSEPQLELIPEEHREKYPFCVKCGVERVYAVGGPHMNWCEPCLWAHVKSDRECDEPKCELKPKIKKSKKKRLQKKKS